MNKEFQVEVSGLFHQLVDTFFPREFRLAEEESADDKIKRLEDRNEELESRFYTSLSFTAGLITGTRLGQEKIMELLEKENK